MKLPTDIEVFEQATSYLWIDENGILCIKVKDNAPDLTLEEEAEENKIFMEWNGDVKRCILIQADKLKPSSAKKRNQSAKNLDKVTKALALVHKSPMGRMLINIFISIHKPKFPIKIFGMDQLDEAKKWLKQYV